MPLVSRGKRITSNVSTPSRANDGKFKDTFWVGGNPTPAAPTWIALEIGTGPSRLFLEWTASGSYSWNDTVYGSPGDFTIETSADSTDGANGTWSARAAIVSNDVRSRTHLVGFGGEKWVRMVFTAKAAAANAFGINLDEISVYDASGGSSDSFAFVGDSVTAFAFDRATPGNQPSFAELVHASHPAFFPSMINAGIGASNTTTWVTTWLDAAMTKNPDTHFWAIHLGIAESFGNSSNTTLFRSNMQTIISRIVAAGHIPILAKVQYVNDGQHAGVPSFNAVVDNLTQVNGLPVGPDLYTWFQNHPEELPDNLHPNLAGRKSTNRLWAEALDGFYK
jgi:acyl-CoA thioesterase I